MTNRVRCDCCGRVDEVVGPPTLPAGWIAYKGKVDLYMEDGLIRTWETNASHSCPDCNSYMEPAEICEAFEGQIRSILDQRDR